MKKELEILNKQLYQLCADFNKNKDFHILKIEIDTFETVFTCYDTELCLEHQIRLCNRKYLK